MRIDRLTKKSTINICFRKGTVLTGSPLSGNRNAPTNRRTLQGWQRKNCSLECTTCEEMKMLSPHEFATLMLVRDALNQADLNRGDLDALLEHQFVTFEKLISGGWHLHLTVRGQSILKAVTRNSLITAAAPFYIQDRPELRFRN